MQDKRLGDVVRLDSEAKDDWKPAVLRRLVDGDRFQLTYATQRDAARDFKEFVRFLTQFDAGLWMAHGAVGNLRVEFVGGGCVWFDSYKVTRDGIRCRK